MIFNSNFQFKIKYKTLLLLLGSCLFSSKIQAFEYGIGGGVGFNSNMIAYRLSLQNTAYYFPIRGYWQLNLNGVQGRKSMCCSGSLWGGSFGHVFSFSKRCPNIYMTPYGEFGLGIAIWNKDRLCERNLGLRGLFEVIFGVGFRFGPSDQYDFGYKFIHYSNAYLGKHNDGLNFNFITLNYWFN